MRVTLYKKSGCPWAAAVSGFLTELGISFEVKNVTSNPRFSEGVQRITGKCNSPTLDIDGQVIADASVEQVAEALEKRGIVL